MILLVLGLCRFPSPSIPNRTPCPSTSSPVISVSAVRAHYYPQSRRVYVDIDDLFKVPLIVKLARCYISATRKATQSHSRCVFDAHTQRNAMLLTWLLTAFVFLGQNNCSQTVCFFQLSMSSLALIDSQLLRAPQLRPRRTWKTCRSTRLVILLETCALNFGLILCHSPVTSDEGGSTRRCQMQRQIFGPVGCYYWRFGVFKCHIHRESLQYSNFKNYSNQSAAQFEKAPKSAIQERKIRVTYLPADASSGSVCRALETLSMLFSITYSFIGPTRR